MAPLPLLHAGRRLRLPVTFALYCTAVTFPDAYELAHRVGNAVAKYFRLGHYQRIPVTVPLTDLFADAHPDPDEQQ